ncbi:MAG: cell division protein FtsZ [Rhodocyclaceae bacterium]|nr:cell division protein FtsZ [Rhodocyclaceae bacterium]MBX3670196.1 cell division protein FtsZ [Rhodocyclaceae bacterium]
MFEIIDKEPSVSVSTIIKVIGVGGAGGNAVDHMIRCGVNGVEFICANTDAQALHRNAAPLKLQLGESGLGAGAKPDAGRSAAEEARERIADALRGANMVFITAGMGGGTGTGAAPVVAEIARELGILTVAVVTKPFAFEGKRMSAAMAGIEELSQRVDSLIVILNDKLMEVLGDDISMKDAFRAADNVLHNAVGGIAEIINFPGLVNVDFQDVKTVMSEMGMAMMGSACASGVDRARIAAEQAVASPLLEGVHLSGARGVLVNITASTSLKMKEVNEVMSTIREFAAEDSTVIFGAVFDEEMGDDLRVTVVATGLGIQRVAAKPTMTVLETRRTGTDSMHGAPAVDYHALDVPAVIRTQRANRSASVTVEAMRSSGVDMLDIPAFLRKQAD